MGFRQGMCRTAVVVSLLIGAKPAAAEMPSKGDVETADGRDAATAGANDPATESTGGAPTPLDGNAAAADGVETPGPLRVLVAGSPPFVEVQADGEVGGPSVRVWRDAALAMEVDYELEVADSVEVALERVSKGTADVAVGPISITAERAKSVSFSQPYFRSALGIAAKQEATFWQRIRPFLSTAFLTALGALLLVLTIVGVLMWLAEHRKNPEEFPRNPVKGIGNGIWFALVTMTTVGYGDRSPRTVAGRIVAGGWMLVALITVSSLTAGIATALTLSQLGPTAVEKAGDLEGKVVATLPGTLAESFVRRHGARLAMVESVPEGLERVSSGKADALVFDRPGLIHALSDFEDESIVLSPRRYMDQGYGFALTPDSPHEGRLDVALLERASENEALFEQFQSGD